MTDGFESTDLEVKVQTLYLEVRCTYNLLSNCSYNWVTI